MVHAITIASLKHLDTLEKIHHTLQSRVREEHNSITADGSSENNLEMHKKTIPREEWNFGCVSSIL